MKLKHFGTFSLLVMVTCALSSCGSKELSFSEALEAVNKNSDLITQLVLWSEQPTQQIVDITTMIDDGWGTAIALAISSQSEQDRKNKTSNIVVDFEGDVTTEGQTISASGNLQLLMNADNLFISITKLGLDSSDPSMAMIAMMANGLTNQRFKLPLTEWQELLGGMDSYFSQLSELSVSNKDLYVETGKEVYQGAFTQFHGTPAYQFTLDQEAYNHVMEQVIEALNTLNRSALSIDATMADEVVELSIDDIQIPVFEGNLLLVGKNQVVMVIDIMEVVVEDMTFVASYRYGPEGMFMTMKDKESDQELLFMNILKEKKNTYSVDIQIAGVMNLEGMVSVDIKKSAFTLGFDLSLHIQGGAETMSATETMSEITIPLKWTRGYKTIKSVKFQEPAEAMDLNDLLMWMLGGGILGLEGEDGYDYYDDYDYYPDDYDYYPDDYDIDMSEREYRTE